MSSKAWALEMALYSKWQNEKLYGLCDALSDASRNQDRGLYFGSIHRTLDHILMVDRVLWDFTVSGQPPRDWDANRKLYDDYAVLRQERIAFDAMVLDALRLQPKTWLDETVSYHHPRLGRDRNHPRQFPLMQMFNHGTHHRSQVTSALHQMGIDYGSTDMPANPLSQY
ncbi:DinB family protein [Dongia sedimenti]|uniref:DinB family protein n=1 Tax=Dongia sedimenti TaxID=3064282 RepID=A0ABU0YL81_9PROT|nr:DinB family protein [Rhodospirillaceae bacterium R-7]